MVRDEVMGDGKEHLQLTVGDFGWIVKLKVGQFPALGETEAKTDQTDQ